MKVPHFTPLNFSQDCAMAGEGGVPHYSLPALATSLLRLSTRELPGVTLLCAFDPGSRILLHPCKVVGLLPSGPVSRECVFEV